MNFSELPQITGGDLVALSTERQVANLITDSRKVINHEDSVFFAITGDRHDGHLYIPSLYQSGVRQFVIERNISVTDFPLANVLKVQSSIDGLQKIAAHHRRQFDIPVIGITGSNGKTIIKEWLYQLLSVDYHIGKNPGSYNSQTGVPLSVWQLQRHHHLGIFEAGISKPGEMQRLERVILPTLGIFSNIGSAHDESFESIDQKVKEKISLFRHVNMLVYCADHKAVQQAVTSLKIPALSWGKSPSADIHVASAGNGYQITSPHKSFTISFPFTDQAGVENAMHCVVLMLHLGYQESIIQQRISQLRAVPMRLELKAGIHNCQIIDDSYNNDLGGLQISLDFVAHQEQRRNKTLILSDILQSGMDEETLVKNISERIHASGIHRFIGIGPVLTKYRKLFNPDAACYPTTEDFLKEFNATDFQNEIILVKGARIFQFEKIIALLQKKLHGTIMEIDLGALVHNLNYFRSQLKPGTKLMVMVKAFAYGSSSVEVANVLQFNQVDYLGVAYADEGVDLRQHHIKVPIMVMNPTEESFQSLLIHNLEPEIYSLKILNSLIQFLDGRPIPVHIKIDTGMHRLGFEEDEIDELISRLRKNPNLRIASIFSHLAGSDEPEFDVFTREQAKEFENLAGKISRDLHISPITHLLNTSGILRFPEYQYTMVRLGIGLYGVDPTAEKRMLKPVATLKTVISQIRKVKAEESIGYSRKGKAERDLQIATIAIGYADGYSRAFSQGKGFVLVKGKRVPVIGNVCMDMTMIDVTGVDAKEGDEVTIFGSDLPISEVSGRIGTIPYEILTNTSDRVKRVFVAEGI